MQISYLYYGDGTEPIVTLTLTGLVACVFCLGLAIGVVLAVGMLLYFQVGQDSDATACSLYAAYAVLVKPNHSEIDIIVKIHSYWASCFRLDPFIEIRLRLKIGL